MRQCIDQIERAGVESGSMVLESRSGQKASIAKKRESLERESSESAD